MESARRAGPVVCMAAGGAPADRGLERRTGVCSGDREHPSAPTPVVAPCTAEVLGIPLAVTDYEQVHRLDGRDDRRRRARLPDGGRRQPRDVRAARTRDARAAVLGADARRARRPAARVGAARARARTRHARLRPRPDGALLRARGARRARRSTSTEAARRRRSSCWNGACASASRACGSRAATRRRSARSPPPRRSGRSPTIDSSGAAVVWVGTGQPKQEQWMRAHAPAPVRAAARRRRRRVRLPRRPRLAGAALDAAHAAWSGPTACAREPRRLWRRYARYNPRFVAGFARQYARHRRAVAADRRAISRALRASRSGAANLFACMTASQSTADVSVVGLGRVGLPLALSLRRPRPRGDRRSTTTPRAWAPCATAGCRSPRPARRSCSSGCTRAGGCRSPSASPTPRARATS